MSKLNSISEDTYINLNQKLKEDIIKGLNEPLDECVDEKEVEW